MKKIIYFLSFTLLSTLCYNEASAQLGVKGKFVSQEIEGRDGWYNLGCVTYFDELCGVWGGTYGTGRQFIAATGQVYVVYGITSDNGSQNPPTDAITTTGIEAIKIEYADIND